MADAQSVTPALATLGPAGWLANNAFTAARTQSTHGRVVVAGRHSIPIAQSAVVDGSYNQLEQVYRYVCTEDVSDIEVLFSNLHMTSAGVFGPGLQDLSSRCSLKLSNVGVGVQGATSNGQTDLPMKIGATGSFFHPMTLREGQEFFGVWLHTYAAPPTDFATGLAAAASGESNQKGTGLTDRTGNGFLANLNPSSFAYLPPVMIRGRPLSGSTKKRVVINGDSVAAAGGNDSLELISGMNFTGWAARAMGSTYAFANVGHAGLSLQTLAAESIAVRAMRLSGIFGSGFTHVIQALGTNDFVSSDTAATSLTNLQNQVDMYAAAGIKSILTTPPPRTNAGNTTEQAAGIYAKRQAFITGVYALAAARNLQVFDTSGLWSDPSNPMLWRTDLGTPTSDGVHPNPVLHTLAKTAFLADIGRLTS